MFSSTGISFAGVSKRSTRVDTEPRFGGELKAINDKTESFLERKGGPEVVGAVVKSSGGGGQEEPGV
jgi:hypothetical protein